MRSIEQQLRDICLALPGVTEKVSHGSPACRGWVGMRLDGDVDWTEVAEMCTDAFRAVAPRRLIDQLDG